VNDTVDAEVVESVPVAEIPLSEQAKSMTTQEKIAFSAKLCTPWQKPMLGLLEAYMKEYPPKTTRADVVQAVSVSLPLRAFVALMSAAQCVIISTEENKSKEGE
jgi:hypothetical protein